MSKKCIYVDGACNSKLGRKLGTHTANSGWSSVVDQDGNCLIRKYRKVPGILENMTYIKKRLPVGKRYIVECNFTDVKAQQISGAELFALIIGLKIALITGTNKVMSDSSLMVNFWSKYLKRDKIPSMDPLKVRYILELQELREQFESQGGKIYLIPGGENPADLGYHV